ncbi:MAG: tyrosine-type recombinase/integrase, partial [Vicinamibacterales bacterium]
MTLGQAIATYVDVNQSVGMRFQVDAGMLRAFHRHAGERDLAAISPDLVVAFLQPRQRVTSTWHMKHRALRRFYQHAIARGLVARSPVPPVVPRVTETFVPHIYSDEELRRLLTGIADNQADTRCTITAPTFRAFLLLMYGAGLRLGEALALRREDVDLQTGMILIRETKFYKSRHLPIGPHLTRTLAEYLDAALASREPGAPTFFVNRRGDVMPHQTAWWNFASLRKRAGVRGRLHDLRHTFAVHRLLAWYREGADVQRLLPHLSTYLGHARMSSTQRYLTMIPELLEQASR